MLIIWPKCHLNFNDVTNDLWKTQICQVFHEKTLQTEGTVISYLGQHFVMDKVPCSSTECLFRPKVNSDMIFKQENSTLTSFRPREVRQDLAILQIFYKNSSLQTAWISFRPSFKSPLIGLNKYQNHSLPYGEHKSSQGRFAISHLVWPKMLLKLWIYTKKLLQKVQKCYFF